MACFELAKIHFKQWTVTEINIKRALKSRGRESQIARAKPALTQEHMRNRKQ